MFHETFLGIDFSSHWRLVCPFISLQKSSILRLVSKDAAKTEGSVKPSLALLSLTRHLLQSFQGHY